MACDPNTLLEQAKCLMTCIPPGMMPAVQTSLLCQLAGGEGGGGLFVLRSGDTMTGALNIGASVGDLAYFSFDPDSSATPFLFTRHVADNAPAILQIRKQGTTGNVDGPISLNDNFARLDFRGWNGASFVAGANILAQAAENFTGAVNGTSLIFSTAAIGGTFAAARMTLTSTAMNLASGVALQLAGVAFHNPLSVYAAGTAYTLTAVSAAVDFGTTDPIITINAAGTYALRAKVKVALNGATFAANRTLTVKLRRTNNTAADVANSSTTWIVPIITTITQTLAVIELPEVIYTTALATDTIQLFADISVLPTAGTISIDEASIVAVRLS